MPVLHFLAWLWLLEAQAVVKARHEIGANVERERERVFPTPIPLREWGGERVVCPT